MLFRSYLRLARLHNCAFDGRVPGLGFGLWELAARGRVDEAERVGEGAHVEVRVDGDARDLAGVGSLKRRVS